MGLFDRMINNAIGSVTRSAGDAIGNAVGNAVGSMASEGLNSITTDMKVKNEEKMMDLRQRQKAENLPTNCPHCGAPTSNQLVCEYCKCKVIE